MIRLEESLKEPPLSKFWIPIYVMEKLQSPDSPSGEGFSSLREPSALFDITLLFRKFNSAASVSMGFLLVRTVSSPQGQGKPLRDKSHALWNPLETCFGDLGMPISRTCWAVSLMVVIRVITFSSCSVLSIWLVTFHSVLIATSGMSDIIRFNFQKSWLRHWEGK